MIRFARHSGNALCFGLLLNGPLEFPPGILNCDLILYHVGATLPLPTMYVMDLPVPFHQVGNGGRHRPSHHIPWMLFGLELLVDLRPCLLQVLELVWGPIVIVLAIQCPIAPPVGCLLGAAVGELLVQGSLRTSI